MVLLNALAHKLMQNQETEYRAEEKAANACVFILTSAPVFCLLPSSQFSSPRRCRLIGRHDNTQERRAFDGREKGALLKATVGDFEL